MSMTSQPPSGCGNSFAPVTSRLARSMIGASLTFDPKIYAALTSAISSPGSGSGATPCDSQAGPMTDLFGQPLCPASPLAPPASKKVMPTTAISPRCGYGSSASAALQSALASKLSQRLASGGSTLFSYALSSPTTPAGRQFFLLAASGRRTSGQGFTGWPTLNSMDHLPSGNLAERKTKGGCVNLKDQAPLTASGATPSGYPAATGRQGPPDAGFTPSSWATPNSVDRKNCGGTGTSSRKTLPGDVMAVGKGQLNPALSRWLMGLPEAWCEAAIAAKRSMPTRRAKRG